jgi:EAL domain-containing protein (putative c-di-GMP-specific phosphodiesterase class I)
VREQGCNEVQGFLFSPPLEAVQVLTLLANEARPKLRAVS